MILATMISTDEDALMCDFAETYHIYDFRQLPLNKAAVFASGLRDDSRIKMKMSNSTIDLKDVLLAALVDRCSFLAWSKCKEGTPKPASILAKLLGIKEEKDHEVFDTAYEYEKRKREITEGR